MIEISRAENQHKKFDRHGEERTLRSSLPAIFLILFFSLTPTTSLCRAQQEQETKPPKPAPQDPDDAIRLSSRLVLVPVSASDGLGRPVRNLTAEDFVIEEEGRRQAIASLGEPGKVPVEIALLFDVSGSVQGQFAFEQQAAVRFIKSVLKPADAVSVYSIGTTPKLIKTRTTSGDEATTGLMSIV